MDRFKNSFLKLCSTVIYGLAVIVLLYLTVLSILSTCNITNKEYTYFVFDNPIFIILGIIIILIAGVLLYNFSTRDKIKKFTNKYKKPLFIAALVFAASIVLCVQLKPVADQNLILKVAQQMREHDFSAFRQGGYVNKCSNQIGIITILYFLSFIFGDYNYLAIQMINVIAWGISVYLIAKLVLHFGKTKFVSNLTLFSLFLFLPLTYYVTFVYGNLIGLALSLIAIDLVYKYFEKRKLSYVILSSIAMSLAVIVKSNYLITLVALVIFILIDSVKVKSLVSIMFAVFMVFSYFFTNLSVVNFIENKTGYKYDYGCPNISYVAMGLLDSPGKAEGWFNYFNWDVYQKNDYNVEVAKEKSYESIKKSINDFLTGERDGVSFFSRKMASQWNNPTFQGIQIQQKQPSSVQSYSWFHQIFFGNLHGWQYEYLNFLQSFILLFALIYFIYNFNKGDIRSLLPIVIFLGGFLFHFFWEAKGQYTITYFILLFPYAMLGFKDSVIILSDTVTIISGRNTNNQNDLKKCTASLIFILVFVVTISILYLIPENKIFNIGGDEGLWNSYFVNYNRGSDIKEGYYTVVSKDSDNLVLSLEKNSFESGTNVVLKEADPTEDQGVYITTFGKYSKIIFNYSNYVLDVDGGSTQAGTNVQQWSPNKTDSQKFTIEELPLEEGVYIIKYDDLVLTYDNATKNVYVDRYRGNSNQKWKFK